MNTILLIICAALLFDIAHTLRQKGSPFGYVSHWWYPGDWPRLIHDLIDRYRFR